MVTPSHLWLLGLSGSGKSTVGPLLAQKLAMPFVDTDERIVQATKIPFRRSLPKAEKKSFVNGNPKSLPNWFNAPPRSSLVEAGSSSTRKIESRFPDPAFGSTSKPNFPSWPNDLLAHPTDRFFLPIRSTPSSSNSWRHEKSGMRKAIFKSPSDLNRRNSFAAKFWPLSPFPNP